MRGRFTGTGAERVEPDYEAALKAARYDDGFDGVECCCRTIVQAAIGDRLLINPPTEEERWTQND